MEGTRSLDDGSSGLAGLEFKGVGLVALDLLTPEAS